MITLGQVFGAACSVLVLLTLVTFWYAGFWWGVGCLIASILLVLFVLLIAHRTKENMETSFKSY
jgi:ABC-type transport system involved in cytochrome bd biosynthesis fused ATPase/permease subunit